MKCIVGLGNPGTQYSDTRHNIGFIAVESLIVSSKAVRDRSTDLYESYRTIVAGQEIFFLMPQTYMNNSGLAVNDFRLLHEIAFDDLLIIYDDFQLPFGTLRMRPKGSDGGHNGLSSIIVHLESDLVPRLRIGVGGSTIPEHHTHDAMADYVLSPFNEDEKKLLPRLHQHTRDACLCWIESGISKTMSLYNKIFFSSAGAE